MSKYNELKRLAEAATPQNFDSAEEKAENGYIECPHCGGQGEVERQVDYCNYDNVAIGVQFYGIGNEFGAAEAYYRAANPAAVMALIADFDAEHARAGRLQQMVTDGIEREQVLREQLAGVTADRDYQAAMLAAAERQVGELREQRDSLANEMFDVQARLDTAMGLLRRITGTDYQDQLKAIGEAHTLINTTSTEGK